MHTNSGTQSRDEINPKNDLTPKFYELWFLCKISQQNLLNRCWVPSNRQLRQIDLKDVEERNYSKLNLLKKYNFIGRRL